MKNLYLTFVALWLSMAINAVTISGTVNNFSDDTGKLNAVLYTQTNYSSYNFLAYEDLKQFETPTYPHNYSLNVAQAGTYAVVVYIDTNNNNTIDQGEPVKAIENIVVGSEDVTAQNFIFGEAPAYSISGSISYAGSITGDVYTYVFKQSDFLAQDLTSPVGIVKSASPTYPIDYFVPIPEEETYVVFSFIDENGSGLYTVNETMAYQTNVVVSNENSNVEVDLTFPDTEKYLVSGTIAYDGTTIGKLYIVAFKQAEFEVGNLTNPINIEEVEDPIYPYDYELNCPDQTEYALLAFIDYNGNNNYDSDEPYDTVQNVLVDGAAISDQDMRIEEKVVVTAVFQLDTLKSTWDNGQESGTFHEIAPGGYSPGVKNGRTAMTMDSFEEDTLLYGFGFWIDETDMDELDSSYWVAGTKMHLEYSYPDSLDINFIAVGSLVDGVKILDNRLIIDVEVVNPVHSASGDFEASCGISVSCDPKHSGGVDCHGAIFYGDLYAGDMTFIVNRIEDKVGMRVNGYNGVEGHFTAILPDSFLINVLQVDGNNLPQNSEMLDGFIPDLIKGNDYSVTNNYLPITSGFDVDGDGKDNTMYKVTINNSSWSPHDLLFGAAMSTAVELNEITGSYILLRNDHIEIKKDINSLQLYDITGTEVLSFDRLSNGERVSLKSMNIGVYIIRINGAFSDKIFVE